MRDDKKIRKVLNLLRKMDNGQRSIVFDWLKDWHEWVKECEAIEAQEDPDRCACQYDEINLYCTECF